MVNKRNEEKVIDVVKDNAVWIKSVEKEKLTATAWDSRWGFYKDVNYMILYKGLDKKKEASLPKIDKKFLVSSTQSKLPPGLTDDPNSLMSAYLNTYNIKLLTKYHYPTEKYLAAPTTQSEIGWTNGKWLDESQLIPYGQGKRQDQHTKTYVLDRYTYCRGKGSVFKWWGGGPDSLKRRSK